jgi:hypothetical protein
MGGTGRRRESILWPLAVLAVVGAVLFVVVRRERGAARERVANEDTALATARTLGRAEQAFHARTGRYGWLEELRDAGLLPPDVPTRMAAHGLQALNAGYMLDVLLPSGRAVVGEVPLGTHATGPAEPALASRHFAVVARPERPGKDGFRIWYLDEEGRVFLSEGVSDVEGLRENPLPLARVTRPKKQEEPGLVWRRLDELDRD